MKWTNNNREKKKEEASAAAANVPPPVKGKEPPRLLRGMKDLLPQDAALWDWIETVARQVSRESGFERLDPPHLEDVRLFVRAVGKETDIVEKELFSFIDQGGDTVALRPEFTASMVRAYIEHGFLNQP